MRLTAEQLRAHVEAMGGSEGERGFACEVRTSPRGEAPFDFSIHFHSARWSPTTVRCAGPPAIKRYLEVFNDDNDARPRSIGTSRDEAQSRPVRNTW